MNRKKFLQVQVPFGGLHPPFARRGKALLNYDSEEGVGHSEFLLQLALSDCESENPFQDLGIKRSIIFSILREGGGVIHAEVERAFNEFSDRFRLDYLDVQVDHERGEATSDIKATYIPFGRPVAIQHVLAPEAGGDN